METPVNLDRTPLARRTRRQLFQDCGVGVGKVALTSLFVGDSLYGDGSSEARGTHHRPRAKSVIYLFMAGAPSQFELFQPKPELQKLSGQTLPPSMLEGKRFAFMESFVRKPPKLLERAASSPGTARPASGSPSACRTPRRSSTT